MFPLIPIFVHAIVLERKANTQFSESLGHGLKLFDVASGLLFSDLNAQFTGIDSLALEF